MDNLIDSLFSGSCTMGDLAVSAGNKSRPKRKRNQDKLSLSLFADFLDCIQHESAAEKKALMLVVDDVLADITSAIDVSQQENETVSAEAVYVDQVPPYVSPNYRIKESDQVSGNLKTRFKANI